MSTLGQQNCRQKASVGPTNDCYLGTERINGGNNSANDGSLFGDLSFCKYLNFIMINYKFTIHDTPHFAFLYFEWMYNMMSILVKEAGKITEPGKHLYQWDCF